jgi:putative proteasome-type protease
MTYCVGLLVNDGLVMIADSRTNAGVDNISVYRKLHVFEKPGERVLVIATAGNLSVTQTALNLLREGFLNPDTGQIETLDDPTSTFRAARLIGHAVRQVRDSMEPSAMQGQMEAGVNYDASLLVGGQVIGQPLSLYLVYGAGNFIECGPDTPYLQIGECKYGKPILDRALTYDTDLGEALKLGLISFDSTIRSNLAVGLPLDLAVMRRDSLKIDIQHRVESEDAYFQDLGQRWSRALNEARRAIPAPPYAPAAVQAAAE